MLGLALAFGFGLMNASVRAEQLDGSSSGRFVLDIRQCPKPLPDSTRRFIGIEVGDLLYDESESAPEGADTLTIRCAGNLASIEAAGATERAPLEKLFNLDDFPGDAAPRALALASLELMAARNATVRERMDGNRNSETSQPKPLASKPAAARVATAPSIPHRETVAPNVETRMGLAGIVRIFPVKYGPTLLGGQLQANTVFNRLWWLAADLEVSGGLNEVSLGATSAVLYSGGATLGVQARSGIVETGFGFGGRLGGVRLSGSSTDLSRVSAHTVFRPWGGPMATASISCWLNRAALTVVTEIGLSELRPEGKVGSATAITLDGPWAAIAVGASIRL